MSPGSPKPIHLDSAVWKDTDREAVLAITDLARALVAADVALISTPEGGVWETGSLNGERHCLYQRPVMHENGRPLLVFALFASTPRALLAAEEAHLQSITSMLRDRALLAAARAQKAEADELLETVRHTHREALATFSHEMRTPLNALLGLTDILGSDGLNEHQTSVWTHIKSSTGHLVETLNALLDQAKLDAARTDINTSVFALSPFIEETIAPFRWLAEAKGLAFAASYPSIELICETDKIRVRQVLNNLLSNAMKFTDRGAIRFVVEVLNSRDGRGTLGFRVTDTGIGIAPELEKEIFKPYAQLSGEPERGGTGLGLSICKQLTIQLCGELGYQSAPKKGSSFWMRIPVTLHKSLPREEPGPGIEPLSGRILLIEDNELGAAITQSYLIKAGLNVTLATNLNQAKEALALDEFDLVLSDLHLGSLPPGELLTAVSALSTAPLIIISGKAVSRTLHPEIDDAVMKPFTRDVLLKAVRAWLFTREERDNLEQCVAPALKNLQRQCGDVFLREAIERFMARNPKDLARMESYLHEAQWDKLELAAHSLKSTLSTLGLRPMTSFCSAIEDQAPGRDAVILGELLKSLRKACKMSHSVLLGQAQSISLEKVS